MADETLPQSAIPPKPPTGEIVSTAALYATQISLYQNSLAFGGSRNPSTIWQSMTRNEGRAILFYRELEEKDEDVGNALDTLKEAVMERDWSIEPFDDSSLAADVAAFIQAQVDKIPNIDLVLDNMLDAPAYGFSVQEMIFDASGGQAELLDIHDCPQELFLFGDRFTPQIGPLQFLDTPYASSGQLVPEEKFLIYSHRPRSRNRMGRPLLRSVFWPSWMKRNMLRLWLQYAEKGPGTAVVRYADSNNPAEAQKAADLALALIENVAVGVPSNFDYDKELLTIARSINPDVHEHFFNAMQLSIARKILGETLTSFGSEKGVGSKGMGQTHSATKDTKAVRICKATAAVLNEQLIRPLILWNYGPAAPMPKWKFDTEEPEDLQYRMGIDQGAQRMGAPIPVSYIQAKYDIPVPAAGDVIAVPNVTAPQPTITETTRASFAEKLHVAQAEVDMAEFDLLTKQLQDDALGLLKERVGQVAAHLSQTGVS